jgi:hypothetical protein
LSSNIEAWIQRFGKSGRQLFRLKFLFGRKKKTFSDISMKRVRLILYPPEDTNILSTKISDFFPNKQVVSIIIFWILHKKYIIIYTYNFSSFVSLSETCLYVTDKFVSNLSYMCFKRTILFGIKLNWFLDPIWIFFNSDLYLNLTNFEIKINI